MSHKGRFISGTVLTGMCGGCIYEVCSVRASSAHKIFILSSQRTSEIPEFPAPEPLEMSEAVLASTTAESIENQTIIHDFYSKTPGIPPDYPITLNQNPHHENIFRSPSSFARQGKTTLLDTSKKEGWKENEQMLLQWPNGEIKSLDFKKVYDAIKLREKSISGEMLMKVCHEAYSLEYDRNTAHNLSHDIGFFCRKH